MTTRTLDWKSRHDPRSRQHGVRALIPASPRRVRVLWKPPAFVLDQGQEGACVPHGWIHEAAASPVRVNFNRLRVPAPWPNGDPQALAFALYDWCRKHDEFPGDDTAGTSVLQGAKAMQAVGLLKAYRWCFSTSELVDALIAHGPVVLGIPWLDGMYSTAGDELRVTGQVVGGHCILAIGYDPTHRFADGTVQPAVLLLNSWGGDWGRNGCAWIRLSDLGRLLEQFGEMCVPTRRSYGVTRALVAARTAAAAARRLLG